MTAPTDLRTWRVSDLAVSLIRTLVPMAVGAALTWAAQRWHVVLPAGADATAGAWTAAAAAGGWYTLARYLEHRGPKPVRWLGRFMLGGVVRVPVYVGPDQRVRVFTASPLATGGDVHRDLPARPAVPPGAVPPRM